MVDTELSLYRTVLVLTLISSRLGKVQLIWQGGDEDIEGGGLRKYLDTRKGGSEKIVALARGARKICILQNQQERRAAPKKLNR